jgi:DNA-directed RNA polymerase specialized sigma24 family protein
MATEGSITRWFHGLQGGNHEAAQRLWERFSGRLMGLARTRLQTAPRLAADEEDAVLSAFDSFCRGAEQGRFPQLEGRDQLWHLLVTITLRKVYDQVHHEQRHKRGKGTVLRESDLARSGEDFQGFDEIVSREPTPQLAAEIAEECQRLLGLLGDADLRTIALLKMEGYSNLEIAQQLDCARSTIQRKLNLIQARWSQELAENLA